MNDALPLIPLRGAILFPDNSGQFDIGREQSVAAAQYASGHGGQIIFAVQKDGSDLNPETAELQRHATLAKIISVTAMQNNSLRVFVEGTERIRLTGRFESEDGKFLSASFERVSSPEYDDALADAYKKGVYGMLEEFTMYDKGFQPDMPALLKLEKNHESFIYKSAALVTVKDAYDLLEEDDIIKRFEILIKLLGYELEVLKMEKKINVKVKRALDKNQKEYILREQMKVISDELDDTDGKDLAKKISLIDAPEDIKAKLLKELSRLKKISMMSPEYSILTGYIEFAAELPWNKRSKETRDLAFAKEVLDRDHYGLKKVKERILEYIAVHSLTDAFKSPILCFIGPPGVGKTSVARSIAGATGREFVRMSLGGISDESEIRGHRKTYVAAMPGRVLAGIKQAGVSNPVFLLDEIDKLTKSNHGDPASALLEVLDPEQNSSFRDNFLELPYDLSRVLFVTTANDRDSIPAPLLDRMEIIEMPSYSPYEKLHIAKNHLIPKQIKENGLSNDAVSITDEAVYAIIYKYTSEAGVRELERRVSEIMRKAAVRYAEDAVKTEVEAQRLSEYLGKKTIIRHRKRENDEIGVATGLAWTATGGDILPIEINAVRGKGDIVMTGNLRDIIKESVKVALTYIHSIAEKCGIDESAFKSFDYHVHLPEASVPKEGPSAGIGFAAAIYSALTRRPIRSDTAMTGELSLRGKISAVGGVKEKLMAGFRAGIERFFIPKDNLVDIDEIPEEIADKIDIFPVGDFDSLLVDGLVFGEAENKKDTRVRSDKKKLNEIASDRDEALKLIIEATEKIRPWHN